jgi:hypothetical protein
VFLGETPRGRSYSEDYKQAEAAERTSQLQDRSLKRKDLESRRKTRKFEEGDAEERSVCARS